MIPVRGEGLEDLLRDLRKAQADVQGEARAVLKEQAKVIRDDARSRCPEDTGTLKRSVRSSVSREKLDASVSAGGKVRGKDAYYAQFVEFGTKHSPAQPFLYPAGRAHEKETEEKLVKVLTDAVRKGAGG
jgi:HK97 gp10 family phage protein